ncbi:MAG TPA: fluoride efflux transporter CrcB [Opitutales bacterium]|nr:fluoride efflux transporter CrcB [Opitutales bacterium]
MLIYLYVAFGGALGTAMRFALSGCVARHFDETFPWGTLVINVLGSFVIGFFSTLTEPEDGWLLVGPTGRQFFMTGVLGGFTTFSSFSLQTLALARDGDWAKAGGNIIGSMALCLVGVWLGHILAAAINFKKGH